MVTVHAVCQQLNGCGVLQRRQLPLPKARVDAESGNRRMLG